MKQIVQKIENEAKKIFKNTKGCHDWDHTERVLNLCMHIGKKEKANIEILILSALLHDIAREDQDKSNGLICHAEKGAKTAREILKKYNFPEEKVDEIIHCIKCHRFRGGNIPKTLEAKILFDADKLDAIGAIGIGRAFVFSGEIGARIHNTKINIENSEAYSKDNTAFREFMVKLRKVKDKILTKEGKRFAKDRHDFMKIFFNRLNKETEGKI